METLLAQNRTVLRREARSDLKGKGLTSPPQMVFHAPSPEYVGLGTVMMAMVALELSQARRR